MFLKIIFQNYICMVSTFFEKLEGRTEGRKEGRQAGRKAGRQAGRQEGRQAGVLRIFTTFSVLFQYIQGRNKERTFLKQREAPSQCRNNDRLIFYIEICLWFCSVHYVCGFVYQCRLAGLVHVEMHVRSSPSMSASREIKVCYAWRPARRKTRDETPRRYCGCSG